MVVGWVALQKIRVVGPLPAPRREVLLGRLQLRGTRTACKPNTTHQARQAVCISIAHALNVARPEQSVHHTPSLTQNYPYDTILMVLGALLIACLMPIKRVIGRGKPRL